MQSARTNTENEFLIVIANPANKKDALWNDVLAMVTDTCNILKNHGAVYKSFLNKLVEVLWYIKGHATSIGPESLRKVWYVFKVYRLQLFRGKQTQKNLSEAKLSLSLKDVFHCLKFVEDSKAWCDMRIVVLKLAQVLEDYTTYLRAKTKLLNVSILHQAAK